VDDPLAADFTVCTESLSSSTCGVCVFVYIRISLRSITDTRIIHSTIHLVLFLTAHDG